MLFISEKLKDKTIALVSEFPECEALADGIKVQLFEGADTINRIVYAEDRGSYILHGKIKSFVTHPKHFILMDKGGETLVEWSE